MTEGLERYDEHAPPPSLRPWVRTIWTYASPQPSGAVQRIAPDGCPELLLDIASPYEEQGPDGVFRLQPQALFAGQMTGPWRCGRSVPSNWSPCGSSRTAPATGWAVRPTKPSTGAST